LNSYFHHFLKSLVLELPKVGFADYKPNHYRIQESIQTSRSDTTTTPADINDQQDFENSDRGLIAKLDLIVIKDSDGRVVWDMNWAFLGTDCPDTVKPSLWRQAQLNSKHGLYEVVKGIYQVRGTTLQI
jgi:alkyl sulfatase BDS1-like metallo-beta-lactamase superfamily hydrolase